MWGAVRFDRVKKGMYVSVAMGIIYTVCTGILLLAFAPQVIGVFTQNGKVVEYGVYIMRFFCPFYWMLGILHILAGTIREPERRCRLWLCSCFHFAFSGFLWIWGVMSVSHKIGGVMLGYPLSWLVGLVMILIYVWKGNWMPYGMKKDSTK